MAFMLPLAITGVGTISGFVAGYYYGGSNPDTETNLSNVTNITSVTEKELKKLKEQSPYVEIKNELINFDKKKLKKTNSDNVIVNLTSEQQLMENLRQKILNRRSLIDPISRLQTM